jgi:hypothetical protein
MKKGTAWGIWWVAVIYGILFFPFIIAKQSDNSPGEIFLSGAAFVIVSGFFAMVITNNYKNKT